MPCQKALTISTYAAEKAPKNQVARQDPGYRGPKEGGGTKRAYPIEYGEVEI